jgi:hypothetical protein
VQATCASALASTSDFPVPADSEVSGCIEWHSEGSGQTLKIGDMAKGQFTVVYRSTQLGVVTLERTAFSGPLGLGIWLPQIEVRSSCACTSGHRFGRSSVDSWLGLVS